MSAHAKKRPTDKVRIQIGDKRPRFFLVPKKQTRGVAELLSDFEIKPSSEFAPWREAFKDLHLQHSEASVTLQGARLKQDMTQVELAKKLNVTQADISNMEHGRRAISKKMAMSLAKIFNLDYRIFI